MLPDNENPTEQEDQADKRLKGNTAAQEMHIFRLWPNSQELKGKFTEGVMATINLAQQQFLTCLSGPARCCRAVPVEMRRLC